MTNVCLAKQWTNPGHFGKTFVCVGPWCILHSWIRCAAIKPSFHFFNINQDIFSTGKFNHYLPSPFSYLTVCCHVSCICQVPPQHRGRGNVLRPDRTVGQQKQQEDACAEDAPVSDSTYGTEWRSRPVLAIPVKREFRSSPLLSSQHPVYCVSVVGTQNANNLISISTDGKMCSWSLDMLSQPQVINKFKSFPHLLIRFAGGERLFSVQTPSVLCWLNVQHLHHWLLIVHHWYFSLFSFLSFIPSHLFSSLRKLT